MSVLNMYNDFRLKFSEITKKADEEHIKCWDEINPDFAYSWFESLAKAINREMHKGVAAQQYKDVFEYLRKQYLFGDDKIKDCIDVSFTENLFWQVKPSKAEHYWLLFPDVLKDLYVHFYSCKPC